jgi:hypothetical protein
MFVRVAEMKREPENKKEQPKRSRLRHYSPTIWESPELITYTPPNIPEAKTKRCVIL